MSLLVDIIETDDTIIVHVKLKGIKQEKIKFKITETKLRFKAHFEDELKGKQPRLITNKCSIP